MTTKTVQKIFDIVEQIKENLINPNYQKYFKNYLEVFLEKTKDSSGPNFVQNLNIAVIKIFEEKENEDKLAIILFLRTMIINLDISKKKEYKNLKRIFKKEINQKLFGFFISAKKYFTKISNQKNKKSLILKVSIVTIKLLYKDLLDKFNFKNSNIKKKLKEINQYKNLQAIEKELELQIYFNILEEDFNFFKKDNEPKKIDLIQNIKCCLTNISKKREELFGLMKEEDVVKISKEFDERVKIYELNIKELQNLLKKKKNGFCLSLENLIKKEISFSNFLLFDSFMIIKENNLDFKGAIDINLKKYNEIFLNSVFDLEKKNSENDISINIPEIRSKNNFSFNESQNIIHSFVHNYNNSLKNQNFKKDNKNKNINIEDDKIQNKNNKYQNENENNNFENENNLIKKKLKLVESIEDEKITSEEGFEENEFKINEKITEESKFTEKDNEEYNSSDISLNDNSVKNEHLNSNYFEDINIKISDSNLKKKTFEKNEKIKIINTNLKNFEIEDFKNAESFDFKKNESNIKIKNLENFGIEDFKNIKSFDIKSQKNNLIINEKFENSKIEGFKNNVNKNFNLKKNENNLIVGKKLDEKIDDFENNESFGIKKELNLKKDENFQISTLNENEVDYRKKNSKKIYGSKNDLSPCRNLNEENTIEKSLKSFKSIENTEYIINLKSVNNLKKKKINNDKKRKLSIVSNIEEKKKNFEKEKKIFNSQYFQKNEKKHFEKEKKTFNSHFQKNETKNFENNEKRKKSNEILNEEKKKIILDNKIARTFISHFHKNNNFSFNSKKEKFKFLNISIIEKKKNSSIFFKEKNSNAVFFFKDSKNSNNINSKIQNKNLLRNSLNKLTTNLLRSKNPIKSKKSNFGIIIKKNENKQKKNENKQKKNENKQQKTEIKYKQNPILKKDFRKRKTSNIKIHHKNPVPKIKKVKTYEKYQTKDSISVDKKKLFENNNFEKKSNMSSKNLDSIISLNKNKNNLKNSRTFVENSDFKKLGLKKMYSLKFSEKIKDVIELEKKKNFGLEFEKKSLDLNSDQNLGKFVIEKKKNNFGFEFDKKSLKSNSNFEFVVKEKNLENTKILNTDKNPVKIEKLVLNSDKSSEENEGLNFDDFESEKESEKIFSDPRLKSFDLIPETLRESLNRERIKKDYIFLKENKIEIEIKSSEKEIQNFENEFQNYKKENKIQKLKSEIYINNLCNENKIQKIKNENPEISMFINNSENEKKLKTNINENNNSKSIIIKEHNKSTPFDEENSESEKNYKISNLMTISKKKKEDKSKLKNKIFFYKQKYKNEQKKKRKK